MPHLPSLAADACCSSIPPPCCLLQVPHHSSLLSPPGVLQKHPPVLQTATWPVFLVAPPAQTRSHPESSFFLVFLSFPTQVLPFLCISACPFPQWSLFCAASYSVARGPCTTGARVSAAMTGGRGVRASLVAERRRMCEGTAGGMSRACL